jgi:polyisoprenoid-binding protein YceI
MTKSALLVLLAPLVLPAAEYRFEMNPQTTNIEWTLGATLHTVHGTFKLKRGEIRFDTANGKASGEVVVDAASGESGNHSRDNRMRSHVLESEKYPEVSFIPDRFEGTVDMAGTSDVKLHGVFRIHGESHELTIPVPVTARENQLDAKLNFDVPFVAWGMKDPSTMFLRVAKSVHIEIHGTGRFGPGGP